MTTNTTNYKLTYKWIASTPLDGLHTPRDKTGIQARAMGIGSIEFVITDEDLPTFLKKLTGDIELIRGFLIKKLAIDTRVAYKPDEIWIEITSCEQKQ